MISELEAVEDRAALNNQKAEAAYHKFVLFYTIGEKLAEINAPKIGTETTGTTTEVTAITEEPKEVGTQVKDANGDIWERISIEDEARWFSERGTYSWEELKNLGPLTLYEETESKTGETTEAPTTTAETEREKWTLESAIEEARKMKGYYSDNKGFIDQLYEDGWLSKEEYIEINGEGFFNAEEDMNYVLTNVLLPKKAEADRKAEEQETGETTSTQTDVT